MCGRFIVFSERDAAEVLTEMAAGRLGHTGAWEGRDVYPKNTAPVFVRGEGVFQVKNCVWLKGCGEEQKKPIRREP